MGPWLTEKIDEKVGLTLKIKSTLYSEATPYHSNLRIDTAIKSFNERLSLCLISLRNR